MTGLLRMNKRKAFARRALCAFGINYETLLGHFLLPSSAKEFLRLHHPAIHCTADFFFFVYLSKMLQGKLRTVQSEINFFDFTANT